MAKKPTAIITGATSGIGAEYARKLAEKGDNLIITGRRTAVIESVAKEIRKTYKTKVTVVIADFTSINSRKFPNPNVITEAAHARAINKPLIIITQGTPEDLPFDWRNYPTINYENTMNGLIKLEKEIGNKINDTISKTLSNMRS